MLLFMVADGNRRGYRHLLRAFWDEAKAHGLPLPTDEPISAFPEKSTSVFLMVIKRLHVFAAMEQLTDGD